ncbi:MAG: hypothetical protein IJV14_15095 [Lachnospiraceae bacterium]|nr:hypothetical protein [Lachnospiraceae bacterium]
MNNVKLFPIIMMTLVLSSVIYLSGCSKNDSLFINSYKVEENLQDKPCPASLAPPSARTGIWRDPAGPVNPRPGRAKAEHRQDISLPAEFLNQR